MYVEEALKTCYPFKNVLAKKKLGIKEYILYFINNFQRIGKRNREIFMVKGIVIEEHGGPEVMRWGNVNLEKMGPNDVLIEQSVVGLNYIDIYHRSGSYPLPLPSGIGMEAVGKILDMGEMVKNFQLGDRVGYVMGQPGSYAEQRIYHSERLIKIPANISDENAAAMLLKGLTVSYLINRTYQVKINDTVLFHAIAGGVGLLACQWLKQMGVTVIGTVSNGEKAEIAKKFGCDHIINYNEQDFSTSVLEITEGKGVPIVYDGVGKDTFEGSLKCLSDFGVLASFGAASGTPPPCPISLLAPKSLYLTRPGLGPHTATKELTEGIASPLFKAIENGLSIPINQHYQLKDAAKAHQDLAARKTIGCSILKV